MFSGMTQFCIFFLSGIFLLGCQNEQSSHLNKVNCEPGTSLVDNHCIENSDGKISNSDPDALEDKIEELSLQKKFFSKMNQGCISATGQPLSADMQCLCTDPDTYQLSGIFNAKANSCVKLIIDDFNRHEQEICQSKGHLKILEDDGPAGLNKCLQGVRTFSENPIIGTDLSIRLTKSATSQDAFKLAQWADQQLKVNHSFFAKLWAPAGNGDQASVYTGQVSGDLFSGESFDSLLSQQIFTHHNEQAGNTIFFYEPDPSKLELMLGKRLSLPDIGSLWPRPSQEIAQSDLTTNLLFKAYRGFEAQTGFPLSLGTPLEGLGCDEVCLVYRKPFSVGAHKAFVSRIYSGGSVVKQTLWLLDASNKLVGAILYGLNGYPSFYMTIDWSLNSNHLNVDLSLYDRTFTRLQVVTSRVIPGISDALTRVAGEAVGIDDVPKRSAVVTCEHFDPEAFEPMDRLIRGPYLPTIQGGYLRSGSIWGWQQNLGGSWDSGLGGLRENPFQISTWTIGHSYSHAKKVSDIILSESPDSYLLPAGKCFYESSYTRHILENGRVFTSELSNQKIAVLNASFAHQESSKSCYAKFDSLFSQLENKLVLVMGAGNSGKENPQNCPQSVRKQNTIVVSGAVDAESQRPGRWRNSDFGADYSDIAAAYHGPGGSEGTSYAAPRVSAVASKLAMKFHNLTPRDIRLAILASAWVPYQKDFFGYFKRWEPLPVSSGGALREESALKLGECLSDKRFFNGSLLMSFEQVRDCLREADLYNKTMANAKAGFLRDRGIL